MTPGMEDDGSGLRVLGEDAVLQRPAAPAESPLPPVEDRERVVELDPDAPEPTPLEIAEAEALEQKMSPNEVKTSAAVDFEPIVLDVDKLLDTAMAPIKGILAGLAKRAQEASDAVVQLTEQVRLLEQENRQMAEELTEKTEG